MNVVLQSLLENLKSDETKRSAQLASELDTLDCVNQIFSPATDSITDLHAMFTDAYKLSPGEELDPSYYEEQEGNQEEETVDDAAEDDDDGNEPLNAHLDKWPQAVDVMGLDSATVDGLYNGASTNSTFVSCMGWANKFVLQRQVNSDLRCTKLADSTVSTLQYLAARMEEYVEDPVSNPGIVERMLIVQAECKKEQKRLINLSAQQRYREQERNRTKECGSVDAGARFLESPSWDNIDVKSIGPITREHLLQIANDVLTSGWISMASVRAMGYSDAKKSHRADILQRQILSCLPLLVLTRPRSRHKYLVDGVHLPGPFVASVLAGDEHKPASMETVVDATKKTLQKEAATWNAHAAEEYNELAWLDPSSAAVQHPEVHQPNETTSTVLKDNPGLVGQMHTILERFGTKAADARRRDDKSYTIGISCRKMREYLHSMYDLTIGHVTAWRMYQPARVTDTRSVHDGGRHGVMDVSTTKVKNNQFVTPHVRGIWCAAKARNWKERITDFHLRGWLVAYYSLDNLARTPCIVDAASQMYARNRGHVLKGDERDWYDHNNAVAKKLLLEVTGIVECQPPQNSSIMTDELGRPRLPRPRPVAMYDYCRGVPQLVSGTQEYMHWADFEQSYLANPIEKRAAIIICCQDNGSGFDPTSRLGAYYACKFAEKYATVKAIGQISPAAGESTINHEVEREWSQHRISIVGQRLGQAFMGGRKAPALEEYGPFYESVVKEVKDIWEANVNISETGDEIRAPRVEHVKPMSQAEVAEALRVKRFFMGDSQSFINSEKNKDIKDLMVECNKRIIQVPNEWFYYKKDTDLAALFGPSKRPLLPERSTCADGKLHYDTHLQQKEKYKTSPQVSYEKPKLKGIEKDLECCQSTFRFMSEIKHHWMLVHNGTRPATKRKRGEAVPFKRRVAPRPSPRSEVQLISVVDH